MVSAESGLIASPFHFSWSRNNARIPDSSSCPLSLQEFKQRLQVTRAVVTLAVDKERWCPVNAAHQISLEVVHNPPDKCLRVQISNKSLNIKAELARIVAYRLLIQVPLMLIERVIHLPEFFLSICSLGGNCGRKSMSMQFT